MKVFTFIEAKDNFSKIVDIIKQGEEVILNSEKREERPLGILKGKAKFKINNDFKITTNELLSL